MKPKNYRRKATRQSGLSKTNNLLAPPDPLAEQLVHQILTVLPSLRLVAVVDVADGRCRAGWSGLDDVAPQTAAQHSAALVRQQQLAVSQLEEEAVEEISFILSTQLHLVRMLPGGQQFVYLVGDKESISLGLVREQLRGQLQPLVVSN
ncbi:hypothetical protein H8B15_15105 [Hymenobacter sp. BT507]|uniref:Roadblock/LAMTOR2 domain-containing protein n=1 Tax=Hymenobacter citatus TaxID=2763506 RepID=A0ABR7MMI2_9BACT|nr:hypothetical protein [Hymenobacter citatus]MBC6612255.1 hypothetical protein [Hymenobacter citatus]